MFVKDSANLITSLNSSPRHHHGWWNPVILGRLGVAGMACLLLCQCGSLGGKTAPAQATNMVVSVEQQKIALYGGDGKAKKTYSISTSKFGLGDKPNTYSTPLGLHEVVVKVGHGMRSGTVFKGRSPTGEVVAPNSPGRDPIVSRIMWLRGLESQNKNAYRRCIYIHGTADEANIGKPVSYGCVRMTSRDVITLFDQVPIGSKVLIVQGKLPSRVMPPTDTQPGTAPAARPPIFINPQQQQLPVPNNIVPPAVQPRPAPTPYETPILAQNTTTPLGGFQARTTANGTVVYSPPSSAGGTSNSRIILRSRRSASDGLR